MKNQTKKGIIIFDGDCNLCNGLVGWLIKFAPKHEFQYVAFQSEYGQELLSRYGFPLGQLTTVIFINDNGISTHSDAFLNIMGKIPNYHLLSGLLSQIPKAPRDIIYNLASRNRVRWFGKSKSCIIDLQQPKTYSNTTSSI
ncbi:thiol-disulfide oxidoreductase DCC family protein [Winogradskyella sp.]